MCTVVYSRVQVVEVAVGLGACAIDVIFASAPSRTTPSVDGDGLVDGLVQATS